MNLTYTPAIAEVIEKLEAGNPLPTLVPQKAWSAELTDALASKSVDELFQGESVKNTTFGDAIKSGLLLWNDALDESHNISQGLANQTGSYWHGIMHRREPDYSNAKYWFGRVGTHPIFPQVRERALAILSETPEPSDALARIAQTIETEAQWDAYQFIDWCQAAEDGTDADVTRFLEQVQAEEIKLLLAYSYQNAV
ncbi:hypothetical protein F4054_13435 [Candidatus Poribacteria bacterium]|nr:hypothetical protein [Candidatus Poribacteria bacterium]MYG09040.1 hypothetical protein [Candidatus Poribacteria bacterium]MYK23247.1 hypothetical protein [Candidatus Poribacteria bacterium]